MPWLKDKRFLQAPLLRPVDARLKSIEQIELPLKVSYAP